MTSESFKDWKFNLQVEGDYWWIIVLRCLPAHGDVRELGSSVTVVTWLLSGHSRNRSLFLCMGNIPFPFPYHSRSICGLMSTDYPRK